MKNKYNLQPLLLKNHSVPWGCYSLKFENYWMLDFQYTSAPEKFRGVAIMFTFNRKIKNNFSYLKTCEKYKNT